MRKLFRSTRDQKLGGVFGGLGEYFNIDANLLRLGGVMLAFFSAGLPVVITYLVAWAILPEGSGDEITTAD